MNTQINPEPEDPAFAERQPITLHEALHSTELETIMCQITAIPPIEQSEIQQMDLRRLKVVDTSGQEVILCLFREIAHTFPEHFAVGDTIKVTNVHSNRRTTLNTTSRSEFSSNVQPITITQYQPAKEDDVKLMSFADFCNQQHILQEGTIKITDVLHIATYSSNCDNIYYGCNQQQCRLKLQHNPTGILICKNHGPIPKPNVYYNVGIQLIDDSRNTKWFSIFDNHINKLTPTKAQTYVTLSDAEKHDVFRNICGSKVQVMIKISKNGPFKNANLSSITLVP